VRFVFHNVPGAEAPAEMTFSIPDKKLYGGAENLTQTIGARQGSCRLIHAANC
jgi:alkyl sulfatase BDS1-like metallo-beta-lactamase superfamily hydrolase